MRESSDSEFIRGFVALLLEASVIEELQVVQRLLSRHLPPEIRWTRPHQLHLTLHFLGRVPAEDLQEVGAWLAQAVSGHTALRLRLGGVGRFPDRGQARVIWVGLEGDIDRLRLLQGEVTRAMLRFGERPSHAQFEPHLTIGRVRPECARNVAWEEILAKSSSPPRPVSWSAREVHLMRSELEPGGARYTVLNSFALAG